MTRLIEMLLGIEAAAWAREGAIHFEMTGLPSGDRAALMAIALVAGVWLIVWLYRRDARAVSLGPRCLLTGLRMVALVAAVVMLLEPVVVFVRREMKPSTILVLVDESQSMELHDLYADRDMAARLARAAGLSGRESALGSATRLELAKRVLDGPVGEALEAGGDRVVRVQPFAGRLLPATTQPTRGSAATRPVGDSFLDGEIAEGGATDALTGEAVDRSSTAIGAAIRESVSGLRGQTLAGVLLVSDGQSNAGEPALRAAEWAKSQGAAITVLAAGTPQGPRNARIVRLDASPVVFIRDMNPLSVVIESTGMQSANATLLVERRPDGGEWSELSRQSITLAEAGQLQTVAIEFAEDAPRFVELRASLIDTGVELTLADNTALTGVRAIRQKIRVLFVAGSSFPEVQFIRNTLLRDKGIDVSTWLQSAQEGYEHPGSSPLRRLPMSQEEMDTYDCVLLYDPDPSRWPSSFPQMLTEFVSQAGGGLIYIAGERMTRPLLDRSGPGGAAGGGTSGGGLSWVSMLPVVCEPGLFESDVSMKLSSREAWRLELTAEGKADPIFQFNPVAEQNERVLRSLPGMYWHFPVSRAKPGAVVLARHGDPRMRNQYGPEVLMATQLVGPGRTFFVAFDSTYRWRYLDEQLFDGFWARIVDRAGRSKQLGARHPITLTTDRDSYRPGSQVRLTARMSNPNDVPPDSLQGQIDGPDRGSESITLTPAAAEPGVFEASLTVQRSGPHSIRVWPGDAEAVASPVASTQPSGPRAATLQFNVDLPTLELDRPGQDRATLMEVARLSGGRFFTMDMAEQVPAAFTTRRVAHEIEDRHEIWRAPLLVALVLIPLFLEWLLRKRYRMI